MSEFDSPPWPWSAGIPDKFVHGYMPAYLRIAAELGPEATVCEIGVYLGHGLRMWQSLFPFGKVWGVDVDSRAVFPEGVTGIIAPQDDPTLASRLDGTLFDLIVDDASHVGTSSAVTFRNLWPLVKPGGYYVVEDCFPCNELGLQGMTAGLIDLLDAQNAECDEVTYRYGLAIVHKRREPAEECRHPEELTNTPVCPHHNAGLRPYGSGVRYVTPPEMSVTHRKPAAAVASASRTPARRIWDTLPYAGEADMLRMHLEEVAPYVHKVVITEAPVTFRGNPRPVYYKPEDFAEWSDKIIHVVAEIPRTDNPWVREFAQRDAAWGALIDAGAELEDVVIIGDTDEIPSAEALAWHGWPVTALQMRTAQFAVDWIVPEWYRVPTQAVMATVRWLKAKNGKLAEIRQNRHGYPVLQDGGWHFSWLGGPEEIARKLDTGTSHTEIAGTLEEVLIRNGMRYTQGASGPTGAPVEPAVVNSSWPAMIAERRCPAAWFRPEGSEKKWVRQASSDPVEIIPYLWAGYKTGKLAFEVGANDGQSIPKMQERYGRVIAFEPYLPNYEIASLSPGADVRFMAVSDHDGEVVLTQENGQLLSSVHEAYPRLALQDNETFTVPCVRLDTVMDEEGVPDFVNMDIEGHELAALNGAERLLAERRTEWLIEFHSKDLQESCAKLLDSAGYDVILVHHPHYAPGSEFYDQHGWLKAAPHA